MVDNKKDNVWQVCVTDYGYEVKQYCCEMQLSDPWLQESHYYQKSIIVKPIGPLLH